MVLKKSRLCTFKTKLPQNKILKIHKKHEGKALLCRVPFLRNGMYFGTVL